MPRDRLLRWTAVILISAVHTQACAPAPHHAAPTDQAGPASTARPTTPAMRKVASPIREVLDQASAGRPPESTARVRVSAAGEIQAYVILTEFHAEHVAALEALGMRVELTLPAAHLVQGWIPLPAVETIAARSFVRQVRPPDYPSR